MDNFKPASLSVNWLTKEGTFWHSLTTLRNANKLKFCLYTPNTPKTISPPSFFTLIK